MTGDDDESRAGAEIVGDICQWALPALRKCPARDTYRVVWGVMIESETETYIISSQ
jgi:hypothetical protein